jgi:hypothetical protein
MYALTYDSSSGEKRLVTISFSGSITYEVLNTLPTSGTTMVSGIITTIYGSTRIYYSGTTNSIPSLKSYSTNQGYVMTYDDLNVC